MLYIIKNIKIYKKYWYLHNINAENEIRVEISVRRNEISCYRFWWISFKHLYLFLTTKNTLFTSDIHYVWNGFDFESVMLLKFTHFYKKFVAYKNLKVEFLLNESDLAILTIVVSNLSNKHLFPPHKHVSLFNFFFRGGGGVQNDYKKFW